MASELRERRPKTVDPAASTPASRARAEDKAGISFLDVLRTITLLVLVNCTLSWFITKDVIFWGNRPRATHMDYWQDLFRAPVVLTLDELKKYDGSDTNLPIYLSINATIYDVSAGRKFYGPGGSYQYFGGADGTRGFVTGCFAVDVTPDLRGVEMMFIPRDNPEVDSQYSSGRLKTQKEQEKRVAKKKVDDAVGHWVDFFAKSKKYKKVGYLKPGWEKELGPVRELCERAEEARPTRNPPPKDG